MLKSFACLTFVLLASACLPVQAALVRYDYAGTLDGSIGAPGSAENCYDLGECIPVTPSVPAGTAFSGSWTVDTAQTGIPYESNSPGSRTVGKIYDFEQFTLTMAGSALERSRRGGTLYITTTDLMGRSPTIWTSGYSTDYSFVAAVLDPDEFVIGGVEVDRIFISFTRDGNDLWTDFALPDNADFFANMDLYRFIVFEINYIYVTGTITSLTATVVPIPNLLPITALALTLIRRRRQSTQPKA